IDMDARRRSTHRCWPVAAENAHTAGLRSGYVHQISGLVREVIIPSGGEFPKRSGPVPLTCANGTGSSHRSGGIPVSVFAAMAAPWRWREIRIPDDTVPVRWHPGVSRQNSARECQVQAGLFVRL